MLILGIDFNNMVFGSFYGSPLQNSMGQNVNAIRGFFLKFQTLFMNLILSVNIYLSIYIHQMD